MGEGGAIHRLRRYIVLEPSYLKTKRKDKVTANPDVQASTVGFELTFLHFGFGWRTSKLGRQRAWLDPR